MPLSASNAEANDSDPGTTTMQRLVQLDNAAWAKLVEKYFDRIYRWCIEAGLDRHAAADVSQEVFVSALGSMHRFQRDETSSFGGWLRRICQRRIVDFRRKKTEAALGGTDAIKMFSQLAPIRNTLRVDLPDLSIQDDRLVAVTAIAQSEFEATTWRAFWMTIVEGRSTTDAAFELGITKNAVYLAKSRITKRLRELLDKPSPE